MPTHAQKKVLPYTPNQIFDLVADVAKYPEFLPWCVGARIKEKNDDVIVADLIVGYGVLREAFTSRVHLKAPDKIDVEYLNGPFSKLNNHWGFKEVEDGCEVDFYIDFEFHSKLLKNMLEKFFNEAVQRMISAFEKRAHELYGS